ncbi:MULTISPECIES: DUF1330 domain-containing protein [Bradyrhizobium]|jgi:uncharacterized protein (DUF1330 family)|uniref:DUF1330 domain-containing protein n=1 Tax=Bradyrhizobium septentrionale TaxID=1404411 RepID=A0A973VZ24_9BRAD|nr:DUF1330 domain-containing protein [Bradyrhizobium septentrionale]UGY13058.1 DUF1330 domain-containing protein [Bradyrhizobium septentrionale]UGY21678.1 DUF1330 domain-containing protein [Bradyrhizobium septentrionale]
MTPTSKFACVTSAAVSLGFLALSGLHAQGTASAPAYVVNEVDVTDQAGFATYAKRQGELIDKFGGRFLARGGKAEAVAGTPLPHRITIYLFDSLAKAQAWHDAPEQAELAAIRDKASNFRSFIVEGCSACKPPAS